MDGPAPQNVKGKRKMPKASHSKKAPELKEVQPSMVISTKSITQNAQVDTASKCLTERTDEEESHQEDTTITLPLKRPADSGNDKQGTKVQKVKSGEDISTLLSQMEEGGMAIDIGQLFAFLKSLPNSSQNGGHTLSSFVPGLDAAAGLSTPAALNARENKWQVCEEMMKVRSNLNWRLSALDAQSQSMAVLENAAQSMSAYGPASR
ncbi:hypothetical protein EV424DRAFT_1355468 [Suillus variegatus]|nr:hypothetical protein EV424DRAFT_1355468 [Suillus variegatus]